MTYFNFSVSWKTGCEKTTWRNRCDSGSNSNRQLFISHSRLTSDIYCLTSFYKHINNHMFTSRSTYFTGSCAKWKSTKYSSFILHLLRHPLNDVTSTMWSFSYHSFFPFIFERWRPWQPSLFMSVLDDKICLSSQLFIKSLRDDWVTSVSGWNRGIV